MEHTWGRDRMVGRMAQIWAAAAYANIIVPFSPHFLLPFSPQILLQQSSGHRSDMTHWGKGSFPLETPPNLEISMNVPTHRMQCALWWQGCISGGIHNSSILSSSACAYHPHQCHKMCCKARALWIVSCYCPHCSTETYLLPREQRNTSKR